MTLNQIKINYLNNELSSIKVYHLIKSHYDELSKLYPNVNNLMSMIYLYINDLDESKSFCHISKNNRRFVSMIDGFMTYCGSSIDRDVNAGINIKNEAIRQINRIGTIRILKHGEIPLMEPIAADVGSNVSLKREKFLGTLAWEAAGSLDPR